MSIPVGKFSQSTIMCACVQAYACVGGLKTNVNRKGEYCSRERTFAKGILTNSVRRSLHGNTLVSAQTAKPEARHI